jgi:hypothetical protein
MTLQIYAFAGRRGSGKSTASQVLVDEGFVDVKFADPLKNMMRAFYKTCGVPVEDVERKLEGDLKEVPCEWLMGKTPRHAMQKLGTEWRDMIDTNLWSNIFTERIVRGEVGDRIVCSDFRFPHEAVVLEELGAYTYRIVRPDAADDATAKHMSETSTDTVPVTGGDIANSGTVAELQSYVRSIVATNQLIAGMSDDEIVALFLKTT